MDMEADLGINSIKRVEIVGAMREKYPNLAKMEAETFAEIHTLGEIIEFMNLSLGAAPAAPLQSQPAAPAVVQNPVLVAVPAPAQSAIGSADVAKALLAIVSEKTGYPTEMLDLTMDMEADLGIDSIKRVEILGGMREVYPDLPKVDPEVFAEMHTLSQVIDHISQVLPGVKSSEPVAPLSNPSQNCRSRFSRLKSPNLYQQHSPWRPVITRIWPKVYYRWSARKPAIRLKCSS